VYPDGYRRDVAQLVQDGHIRFSITAGAHYTVDSRPGEPHTMALPSDDFDTDPRTGELTVRGTPGSALRGTVIHEATHALQDFQRHHSDPETAEGAAYLAGWMASILWGFPPMPPGPIPATGHAHARRLAERVLQREILYLIPPAEVTALNGYVRTGSPHRYVFNGI
jgi:hypothetical protein